MTLKDYTSKPLDMVPFLFLVLSALSALVLTIYYFSYFEFHYSFAILGIVFFYLTTLSITAGYHRLYSHRSYEANMVLRLFYLFFGAAAFQNSALKWCVDHRVHHRYVDTENDPYDIQKGFFFAHMGWMFIKNNSDHSKAFGRDLVNDRLIMWQHKYYLPLALFACFGLPTLIGWAMGSAFAGFLFGGLLRMVVAHHVTFFINSLCHMIGKQTYSNASSGKDSFIMAVLAQGEGYHNYHHAFAGDYRNGIRWFHWDPTKWFVKTMSRIGMTSKLKLAPESKILAARLKMDQLRTSGKIEIQEKLDILRLKVEKAQEKWQTLKADYKRILRDVADEGYQKLLKIKSELRLAQIEFKKVKAQWKAHTS